MKLKFFVAIAAAGFLCGCDRSGAPKIQLDEKFTCSELIEARAINDAVTYGNIWKMPVNAAAKSYGTNTEIESYFKNSVLNNSSLISDIHRKIYEQCVVDSDKSMATAFQEALTQSFEQNKNLPRAGVCVAFNDGRITVESIMEMVVGWEGKLSAQVDPKDPRIRVYQERLEAQCAENPNSSLVTQIQVVTRELTKKEQEKRQYAMDQAKEAFISETKELAEKVSSDVAAGRLPTCAQMVRISADSNSESSKTIDAAVALVTDAALDKLPIDQAAYTRWNIETTARGIEFDSCAEAGGNIADAVAQYNWSKEDVGPWAEKNQHLVQQEMTRRSRDENSEL
ncbi:hypothetical protein HG421_16005 [Xanthomonas campestris pv. badrii]|uniref:Lipoprotein n=1 Tax=Xanthomonas campestris pv. badrii TaxID=149696 RepID=A0A7Z2VCU3_XANCA|nr:hypothetical protein [Xanthomonas campestris]QJD69053.1 hypothetical protein HG421_16005 [Xanthomonas campestris pv. badrii]